MGGRERLVAIIIIVVVVKYSISLDQCLLASQVICRARSRGVGFLLSLSPSKQPTWVILEEGEGQSRRGGSQEREGHTDLRLYGNAIPNPFHESVVDEEEGGLYCRSATRPQNNTTRLRTKGRKNNDE
jgi:hypothetical protein